MASMMAKSLTSFRTYRWRGLGPGWPRWGAAPGAPPGCSTQSPPPLPGWVARLPGWPKGAHPCGEVAAAPEALEHSAEE